MNHAILLSAPVKAAEIQHNWEEHWFSLLVSLCNCTEASECSGVINIGKAVRLCFHWQEDDVVDDVVVRELITSFISTTANKSNPPAHCQLHSLCAAHRTKIFLCSF